MANVTITELQSASTAFNENFQIPVYGQNATWKAELGRLAPIVAASEVQGLNTTANNITNAINELNSSIEDKVPDFKIRYMKGTITIPAGTTSNASSAEILITCPQGYSLWNASLTLGNSQMPFINNGEIQTWIQEIDNSSVTLKNITSIWENSSYYLILFFVKNDEENNNE